MPLSIPSMPLMLRLRGHLFEVAVVSAFLVVGIVLLADPSAAERSPVGRELAGWSWTWASIYVTAAPCVLYSILRGGSNRLRAAALVGMSTGLFMQGVAAATAVPIDPRTVNYFLFAIACAIRAALLARVLRAGGTV